MEENSNTLSSTIPTVPFQTLPENIIDISDWVSGELYDTIKVFGGTIIEFESFFSVYLEKQGIDETGITGFAFLSPTLTLIFKDASSHNGDIVSAYKEYLIGKILGEVSQQEQEIKVGEIHAAIESIYRENEGFFGNWEINNDSRAETGKYQGKNLTELKTLLDTEQNKLYAIYEISKESDKKIALLRQEIAVFAGVGDRHEGGARYFSEDSSEIHNKVRRLTEEMSTQEIFTYIAEVNTQIDGNWKKSDIVSQVNSKLLRALYENYFTRLKSENRPNRDFIDFAKLITGRKEERLTSKNRDGTETTLDAEFDESLAQYDIVNEVLLYVMNRPNGVMDEIMQSQKDFEFGDPEVRDKAPSAVAQGMLTELQKLHPENPEIADTLFEEARFAELLDTKKSYKELSFDEKIQIGALYRVTQKLKSSTTESLQDPSFVSSFIQEEMVHAFTIVKESFDNAFDGYNLDIETDWIEAHPNFFGYSSSDLGLSGEFAEVFDLYQNINGNHGFFNFHDKNFNNITNISTVTVLGMGIIAGAVILSPLFATAAVAGTVPGALALMGAGAQIGLATGVTNIIFSRQGYDTTEEAVFDSATQLGLEVASSALFVTGASIMLQKYFKHTLLSVPLVRGKAAWGGAGITDKGFTVGEVGSGMVVNGATNSVRKNIFTENHFDTDSSSYAEEMKKKTQQQGKENNPLIAGDTNFGLF